MTGPKAGDRVSEYVLVEAIGAGTFGQVWKAHHHIWKDQWAAIKIPTDTQYVRNLQKEGAAVHGLRHSNIVRAIGLDPYSDPPYFVMELVDGPSLRGLIRDNPKGLPVSTARAILRGVLGALDHAHKAGVIHRDIKPENILVASVDSLNSLSSDDVKVTDFGLGHAELVTANSIMQSGSLHSEAGRSISGTIAYMAPEQRDGQPVDARSDLYSVGIVLFEMLTGERPSGGDLPSQIRPDLPAWVDAVFSRLYTRRERRFGSADEVLRAVEQAGTPPRLQGVLPVQPGWRAPTGHTPTACPNCRRPAEAGDNFCILRGHQLVTRPRQCPQCSAYPDAADRYCIFCGAALESHSGMLAR